MSSHGTSIHVAQTQINCTTSNKLEVMLVFDVSFSRTIPGNVLHPLQRDTLPRQPQDLKLRSRQQVICSVVFLCLLLFCCVCCCFSVVCCCFDVVLLLFCCCFAVVLLLFCCCFAVFVALFYSLFVILTFCCCRFCCCCKVIM